MFALSIFLSSVVGSKLAYLDPGSGSFILQIAIATLVGAAVVIRSQWAKIKKLFGKKSDADTEEKDEDQDDEQ